MKIFIQEERQEEIRELLDSVYLDDTHAGIESTCKRLNLNVYFSDYESECFIALDNIEDCSTYVEYKESL